MFAITRPNAVRASKHPEITAMSQGIIYYNNRRTTLRIRLQNIAVYRTFRSTNLMCEIAAYESTMVGDAKHYL